MLVNGNLDVLRAALNEEFSQEAIMIRGYQDSHDGVQNVILNTAASYLDLVRQSIAFMRFIPTAEIVEQTGIDAEICEQARAELVASMKNTLAKAETGESNDAYTHSAANKANGKDTYKSLSHGVKLHRETGTLHVTGMLVDRQVVVEPTYPPTNKRAKTVAKDAFKKRLPTSKWRQYKLTSTNVEAVVIGEQTFEGDAFTSES